MPPLQLDEEGSDKDSDVVSHLTLALPVAGGCRLGVRRDAPAPPWEQGFFIRPTGPNRRRPVPANRSGLTGYR